MVLMLVGLVLFGLVHAVPVWMPNFRRIMVARLGEWPWKGVFALASFIGIWIVVTGWQSAEPVFLYDLGVGVRHAMLLFMPVAVALFAAPYVGSNLTRLVRNQQYTALKLWAFAHILANGDSRSLVLFGGFLVWAVAMVIGVKKRDGAWKKPGKAPIARDIILAVLTALVTIGLAHAHPVWFGVIALPG